MKLLLVSDLHLDVEAAERVVKRAPQADVVVIAGDIGNIRTGLVKYVKNLQVIERPTILVAGNNETTEELIAASAAWPSATVLHGASAQVDGVTFFGLGGAVPVSPFGPWSYDFTEEQAAELLRDCPPGCVLVSHSPPHGVLDRSSRGDHLGSTAVRQAILDKQPQLVVCGHIHASGGQQAMLGTTRVVNAGPRGILLDL